MIPNIIQMGMGMADRMRSSQTDHLPQEVLDAVKQTMASNPLSAVNPANFGAHVGANLGAENPERMAGLLELPREATFAALGQSTESFDSNLQKFGAQPLTYLTKGAGAVPEIDNPSVLLKILGSIVTDPTSFIGIGVGKGALKAGSKLGLDDASSIMRAARAFDTFDTNLSSRSGDIVSSAISAIQHGLLGPINSQIGKRFPILEKLTIAADNEKTLADALQYLDHRGFTWEEVVNNVDDAYDYLPAGLKAKLPKSDLQYLSGVTDPLLDFKEAFHDGRKIIRDNLGITDSTGISKVYRDLTDYWKSRTLITPDYLIKNIMGAAAFGKTEGVPLTDTIGEAGKQLLNNPKEFAAGRSHNDAADLLASMIDMPVPESLNRHAADAMASQTGRVLGSQKMDATILGILGLIGDGPVGGLIGAAEGTILKPLAERVRAASGSLENIARSGGWAAGTSRALTESLADMERVVRDALTQPRATGSIPHPNFADTIVSIIESKGGKISSDEVYKMLKNSAGVTDDVAGKAGQAIDDIIYAASQKGIETSNKFNFDYEDLSNIERTITGFFPFATWYLKAVPFAVEAAAEHPVIFNTLIQKQAASNEYREDGGLTNRVTGSIPIGVGSSLVSQALGRPVEATFDPISSLIPFSGTQAGLERAEFSDNAAAKVLNTLNAFGLSINPFINTALRLAGGYGTDEPAQGLFRIGSALSGATGGIDPNAGLANVESAIRTGLTGREPTKVIEAMAERRLDEMALRETGSPISTVTSANQPYIKARHTHTGPLWERALKEVQQERGLQATAGALFSPARPQAIITPEEKAFREAGTHRLISYDISSKLNKMVRTNPDAVVDDETLDSVAQAAAKVLEITGGEPPPELVAAFQTPTAKNVDFIVDQIYIWQLQEDPLIGAYGASGSPEKRKLMNAMRYMYDVAGNSIGETEAERREWMRKVAAGGGTPLAALPRAMSRNRDEFRRSVPILDAYLTYKHLNPSGDVDTFLEQYKP